MTQSALPPDHADRMARVRHALDGLSVGDAFGEQFFQPRIRLHLFDDEPFVPTGPWRYTDDTEMALAICEVLDLHGRVEQDALAKAFARRFRLDPGRGYGPGMVRLLSSVAQNGNWRLEARTLFSGMGSFGNGSAMRVAPVAAYFTGDGYGAVADQARLSAEVTHRHPDGIAGGVATAVAGAFAWQNRHRASDPVVRRELFDVVLANTPAGEVHDRIAHAAAVPPEASARSAAGWLGNGSKVTCPDTVPFCLWVAARHLGEYETAVWNTVKVGGDIDTNAAIVGGIVALSCSQDGIPAEWLSRREELQADW